MKKLLCLAAVAALTCSALAQEEEEDTDLFEDEYGMAETEAPKRQLAAWPAFFAVGEVRETPDLVGLRVTIPYSTKQESVTGFDLGVWGRSRYFEGFQLSLLRNDVKDALAGVQVGFYNSAAQADLFGVQIGAWNECGSMSGVQVGLINTVGIMNGVQVGLVNRAEGLYGFQVGLVNVIRDAELKFLPIVNIGF